MVSTASEFRISFTRPKSGSTTRPEMRHPQRTFAAANAGNSSRMVVP